MLKKILTSPYFILLFITGLSLAALFYLGFNIPDFYLDKAQAQDLINKIHQNPNNELLLSTYNATINQKFYWVNSMYSLITLCITIIAGFILLGIKDAKDLSKIFDLPSKRIVFLYINLFYLWFAFSTYNHMLNSLNQYVYPIYADSFSIPMVLTVWFLIAFGIFYYIFSNTIFILLYKIKYRNLFLVFVFSLGIVADLCYTFLTCFNQKFSYLTIGDILCNIIWLYLFLAAAKMVLIKNKKVKT